MPKVRTPTPWPGVVIVKSWSNGQGPALLDVERIAQRGIITLRREHVYRLNNRVLIDGINYHDIPFRVTNAVGAHMYLKYAPIDGYDVYTLTVVNDPSTSAYWRAVSLGREQSAG